MRGVSLRTIGPRLRPCLSRRFLWQNWQKYQLAQKARRCAILNKCLLVEKKAKLYKCAKGITKWSARKTDEERRKNWWSSHQIITKWSPNSQQVYIKWSPSGHQVVTKYSSNSQQIVVKWSTTSGHKVIIHFHLLSSDFIHFHSFSSTSSIFTHFHPLASIFIHFHPFSSTSSFSPTFIHFHPLFIHFHPFSSTFIHIHPPSALQVVGKWSASNRQVVGKWSQLVKVCSGIESFGTLKPISGRDGWMDGWDGYIEHYVC